MSSSPPTSLSSRMSPRRHPSAEASAGAAGGGGGGGGGASSSLEESMSWVSFSGFSGVVNDFRSHLHHQPQHHPLHQPQHQPHHNSSSQNLDDSVTSSVLSQSFSSSFRSRRSSLEFGGGGGGGGAPRRGSLLGDISEGGTAALSNPPPRKGVTFHPKVQMKITLSRSDYTEDEISRTWHSKADGERMKRDVLVTVKAMRKLHERRVPAERVDYELARIFTEGKPNACADRTTTDRGLEHMRTTRSVENRRRHKESVVSAVLDEQDALWDENDVNVDADGDAVMAGGSSDTAEAEALRIAEAGMVASRPARENAVRKGQRDARMVEQWRREEEEEREAAMAARTAKASAKASAKAKMPTHGTPQDRTLKPERQRAPSQFARAGAAAPAAAAAQPKTCTIPKETTAAAAAAAEQYRSSSPVKVPRRGLRRSSSMNARGA